MSTSTASRRRTKWKSTPPPPPSPKILHFPRSRRTRRKVPPATTHHHHQNNNPLLLTHKKHPLLFDQDNHESPIANGPLDVTTRRERVEEEEEYNGGGFEEEQWRFQAEILRAECNFLRMKRQFALKKLERNRVQMERTLRSAVHTLVSGREKIYEGKNVNAVLNEEIEDLAYKLQEFRKSSRNKDCQVKKCSNFDKKACVLQRRLDNLGGLSDTSSIKELREQEQETGIDKTSTISYHKTKTISTDEPMLDEVNKCSGRCKGIIRRVVEQVRAETEQWSQMQQMLGQVRGEMEELEVSRDFWENRAHDSDYEIQSLKHDVEEWKERALDYEMKANQLQLELSIFKGDVQKSKADLEQLGNEKLVSSCRLKEKGGKFENSIEEINREGNKEIGSPVKDLDPPVSLAKQLAKEKSMFFHRRSKENPEKNSKQELISPVKGSIGVVNPKRSPLRDIGNSSSPLLSRQTSGAYSRFDSPESCTTIRESIRKREPKVSFLYR